MSKHHGQVVSWVVASAAVLASGTAAAQTVIDRVLMPVAPTSADTVSELINGWFPSTGWVFESGFPSVSRVGNAFTIDLAAIPPTGLVSPVLVPFTVPADLGRLTPGTYTDTINFYRQGSPIPASTFSGSFTVTAVPEPASVLMWGAGLAALLALARRPSRHRGLPA